MMNIHRSQQRGFTQLEWLKSRHSFSFGGYYDPEHMGVSALRVINEDEITPDSGFAPHSHQDMEIITYITQGAIEHQDSMGHIRTLPAGEFQLMSAGTGVTHSEYNPSNSELLKLLQIWIKPNKFGIDPRYRQKSFSRQSGLQLVASPEARDGSLTLHQDACLYRLILAPDERASLPIAPGRTIYIHVVTGHLEVNGDSLEGGDGAAINKIDRIEITTAHGGDALVFDLP